MILMPAVEGLLISLIFTVAPLFGALSIAHGCGPSDMGKCPQTCQVHLETKGVSGIAVPLRAEPGLGFHSMRCSSVLMVPAGKCDSFDSSSSCEGSWVQVPPALREVLKSEDRGPVAGAWCVPHRLDLRL